MADWSWNPDAVGAIATSCGTLVALGIAVIPNWLARRRAMEFSRAVFSSEVVMVLGTTHHMCSPAYMQRLYAGGQPSEREKRTLRMPSLQGQIFSLQFSNELTDLMVQLTRQCDELLWSIENLANPNVDYQRGVCADAEMNHARNFTMVVGQARLVNGIARKIQSQLWRPSRFRCLNFFARKRSVSCTPSDTPEGV